MNQPVDALHRAMIEDDIVRNECERGHSAAQTRDAQHPNDSRPLPAGWRIADDRAMAKLRWASHVFGSVGPAHCYEQNAYSDALDCLRSAIYSMEGRNV